MPPTLSEPIDNKGKRRAVVAVGSVFVLVLLLVAGIFALQLKKIDILIYGVPYYGTFTATPVASSQQAIVDMLLGYWGDTRFSLEDIFKKFPADQLMSELTGTPPESLPPSQIIPFFQANGYEARLVKFDPVSLDTLEQYLKEAVPVVISVGLVEGKNIYEPHLLIGMAHSRKSLIFHTQTRGNNYEIPFSDFMNLLPQNPNLLVIKPLESTIKEPYLRGPVASQEPYSQRLGIMDSQIIRDIQIQLREAAVVKDYFAKIPLLEEIVNNPGFQEFRPDGRIAVYIDLSIAYVRAGKHDEAITLLTTKAIPINHDLDNGFGEWPAYQEGSWPQGQWFYPWTILGEAYYKKGDFVKVREAFNKVLEISPQNQYAKTMLGKAEQEE